MLRYLQQAEAEVGKVQATYWICGKRTRKLVIPVMWTTTLGVRWASVQRRADLPMTLHDHPTPLLWTW